MGRRSNPSVIKAQAIAHIDMGKPLRKENPVRERIVCEAGGHSCGCQQHERTPNPLPMEAVGRREVPALPPPAADARRPNPSPEPQRRGGHGLPSLPPWRSPDQWYDDIGVEEYRDIVVELVAQEVDEGRASREALRAVHMDAIRSDYMAMRPPAIAAMRYARM